MASGFIINGTDLDSLFKARVTSKRADVGFKNSSGIDLSNLYEKSGIAADQISFNTGFTISDGTDLRYLFQRAGYNPFNENLIFTVNQYAGDCWQIYVRSANSYNYRIRFRVAGSKSKDFITTGSNSLIASYVNQGWAGATLYFDQVQLLNSVRTQILATWDVEKSFYTGSDINGITVRAFTIANTADQGYTNAGYTLNSNTYGSGGTASAVFTLNLFSSTQLI